MSGFILVIISFPCQSTCRWCSLETTKAMAEESTPLSPVGDPVTEGYPSASRTLYLRVGAKPLRSLPLLHHPCLPQSLPYSLWMGGGLSHKCLVPCRTSGLFSDCLSPQILLWAGLMCSCGWRRHSHSRPLPLQLFWGSRHFRVPDGSHITMCVPGRHLPS